MKNKNFILVLVIVTLVLFLSACVTVTKSGEETVETSSDTSADAEASGSADNTAETTASAEAEANADVAVKSYSQEAGGFADKGSGVIGIGGGSVNRDDLCPLNTFLTMSDCQDYCVNKEQGECEELKEYPSCYACWQLEDSGCLQGEFPSLSACESRYGDGTCVRIAGPLSCFKKGRGV